MEKSVQQNVPEKTANQPFAQGVPAVEMAGKKGNHFVTKGEKKFDKLTYTTIGYVINALLSVVAVAAIDRTEGGQKFIQGFGNWAKRNMKFLSPEKAEMLATKSFFLSGGFAVLAPMKFLEDAKVGLVKKWNREAYGDKANTDAQIIQSEKELEAAPKQTWSSVFSSRVLALVPFYITVGMLWDRKSNLSKATNKELHTMSADDIKTMEANNPAGFSQLTTKGTYIDKPIAWVSRALGKGFATITGDTAALGKLEAMEKNYPGTIRSAITKDGTHDPAHSAVPYYFISEAITSAMVAWGVYVLTRVLGPIFDTKKDKTMKPVPWQPSSSAIPITEKNDNGRVVERSAEIPDTKIAANEMQHYGAQQSAAPAHQL